MSKALEHPHKICPEKTPLVSEVRKSLVSLPGVVSVTTGRGGQAVAELEWNWCLWADGWCRRALPPWLTFGCEGGKERSLAWGTGMEMGKFLFFRKCETWIFFTCKEEVGGMEKTYITLEWRKITESSVRDSGRKRWANLGKGEKYCFSESGCKESKINILGWRQRNLELFTSWFRNLSFWAPT